MGVYDGEGCTWVVTVKGPKWMGPALRIWVMVVGMDIVVVVGVVVVGVGVDMYVCMYVCERLFEGIYVCVWCINWWYVQLIVKEG